MPKIIFINGPMGAGKSTLSRRIQEELGFYHLNIDELKKPFKQSPGGYDPERDTSIINQIALNLIENNLKAGYNVVVDKTLTIKTTETFRQVAEKLGAKIYLIMLDINSETSQERVLQRDGKSHWAVPKALELASNLKTLPDFRIVDASQTPEEVFDQVCKIITS